MDVKFVFLVLSTEQVENVPASKRRNVSMNDTVISLLKVSTPSLGPVAPQSIAPETIMAIPFNLFTIYNLHNKSISPRHNYA